MSKLNNFILDNMPIIVWVGCISMLYTFGSASFAYNTLFIIIASTYYNNFKYHEFGDTAFYVLISIPLNMVFFMIFAYIVHGNNEYSIKVLSDNNYSIVGFTDSAVIVNTSIGMRTYDLSDRELYILSSKYKDTNSTLNIIEQENWFSDNAVGYGISSTRFDIVKENQ